MSLFEDITRALKHKNYRYYFIIQLFSFIGTWIQSTAQSWLVYRLTESAFFLGVVSFASSIPSLIFAPIAGILADNFNRKNLLIFTQLLCLIHGLILTTLFYTGFINEWWILYLAIFLGIANAIDMTARQSFVPMLVDSKDLSNAIALNSSLFHAARMIGPAIAGYLIYKFQEGICFFINTLSYIPIVLFLFIVHSKKQNIVKSKSALNDLIIGFKYAFEIKPIRALLFLVAVFSFFGISFTTLIPIFSEQVLHSGSKGFGILSAFSGVGALCGAILLASKKEILDIKKILGIFSILGSISIVLFAYSTEFYLSSIMLFISGFSFVVLFAGSNTILQLITPDHLRGRIISIFSTMLMGLFPIGSLSLGYISQIISPSFAISIGGIICFIFGLYYLSQLKFLTCETKKILEGKNVL